VSPLVMQIIRNIVLIQLLIDCVDMIFQTGTTNAIVLYLFLSNSRCIEHRRYGSAADVHVSVLAGTAVRCSRLMAWRGSAGTESGWQSAAPMARREASEPSVRNNPPARAQGFPQLIEDFRFGAIRNTGRQGADRPPRRGAGPIGGYYVEWRFCPRHSSAPES